MPLKDLKEYISFYLYEESSLKAQELNLMALSIPTALSRVELDGGTKNEAVPCSTGSSTFLDMYLDFIKIFCVTIFIAFMESLYMKVNGLVFLMESLIYLSSMLLLACL